MTMRTVRLEAKEEQHLAEVQKITGYTVSQALKAGLQTLHETLREKQRTSPYDIYCTLDLGPGDPTVVSSQKAKQTVRKLIRKKHP